MPKGTSRFLKQQGEGRWEIDTGKIAEAERWDGLHGVITNLQHVRLYTQLTSRPAKTSLVVPGEFFKANTINYLEEQTVEVEAHFNHWFGALESRA